MKYIKPEIRMVKTITNSFLTGSLESNSKKNDIFEIEKEFDNE